MAALRLKIKQKTSSYQIFSTYWLGLTRTNLQFGLCAQSRRQRLVEVGLPQQRFLVTLVLDLVNEYVLGPAELAGHAKVEFALQGIGTTLHERYIVTTTSFSHQWCEFFKAPAGLEETLLPPGVGRRKTAYTGELPLQISNQLLDNSFRVRCSHWLTFKYPDLHHAYATTPYAPASR